MVLLSSADLRSWRHVGHCIPDLRVLGPAYEHRNMGSRFGRGVYAGSLRFHDGRYWMHFTTLDEGIFVTTAEDPAGKWSEPVCLSPEPVWDDPCPLWDADGSAWLVASNPGPSRWFRQPTAGPPTSGVPLPAALRAPPSLPTGPPAVSRRSAGTGRRR
jgi:beta-xylosidase